MLSWQSEELSLEQLMPLFQEALDSGRNIIFSPRGVSMLPMIRQGIDRVQLSPLPKELKKYDLPLYRRRNGIYVLHRIVKVGTTYTCIGDNQYQLETGLSYDQMIGVVTALYRGNRKISVNSFGYQVYCRVWHFSRPIRHLFLRGISFLRRLLK